ncbi:hypothetical protein [Rhodoblastus acidophilus]|uniref:hypothetical protein n=1 Tax=Rhodoblastus acidophilus TaxID=1074 RepID=UPI002224AC6F|nr:hypothetical protein [Rhodoblastus acidophilus]MCW2286883.1 DNA-binding MurR/RpiR family transcriptional regulator [Rhodoblastus acidophilus]
MNADVTLNLTEQDFNTIMAALSECANETLRKAGKAVDDRDYTDVVHWMSQSRRFHNLEKKLFPIVEELNRPLAA